RYVYTGFIAVKSPVKHSVFHQMRVRNYYSAECGMDKIPNSTNVIFKRFGPDAISDRLSSLTFLVQHQTFIRMEFQFFDPL
ncbi:hypothetical protein, partial [Moorena sp. SIO4A1]|uniref:hypothetical protein n=1 Tax=Moorena sp. SIO4A1 TaxID=2607835 RepID=UPI0025E26ABD